MTCTENEIHQLALTFIKECGVYARVRAVFSASQRQTAGDPAGAGVWDRVADKISEIQTTSLAAGSRH